MRPFLIFLVGSHCFNLAVKIIEFHGNYQESSTTLSSATLANNPLPHLPDHFILCSSHYQSHMDTRNTHTIYVIYQDESMTTPWLNIGIWKENRLWANVRHESWHILGSIQSQDLFEWMHICLEIDLVQGTISASINGKSFEVTNVSGLNPSPGFNIRLGIVHHSVRDIKEQFHGKLTNIQLLTPSVDNKTTLTENLCLNRPNFNILSWSDMNWTLSGNDFKEMTIDSSIVCPSSPYADLKVPFKWTKNRAKDMCYKIGKGQITSISNPSNSSSDKSLSMKYGDSECEKFWTPYIYSEMEGTAKNEYTEAEEKLSWLPGTPVNNTGWPNVFFYPAKRYFETTDQYSEYCLVCNTSLKTIYTMRGNCKYSLLGNLKYSAYMVNKYLGFFGNSVIIR